MKKSQLIETIYRSKLTKTNKSTKVKKGVMVAQHTDGYTVGIGFSMCHRRDRFDYHPGTGQRTPGWGKTVAAERAEKWKDRLSIEIPQSIEPEMKDFIGRCRRYFKDKVLPPWAEILINQECENPKE
jgi:hypothetical protein